MLSAQVICDSPAVSSPTSWTNTGATLPGKLDGSQLAIIGNYIYLFGGYNGTTRTNVIYRAPVSNPTSWTNTGSTLPGNLYLSQLAIIDAYVYLFGGEYGTNPSNVILRAPTSNPTSWTNTGITLPTNFSGAQLAIVSDYVYLFGGHNGSAYTNVIYRAPLTPTTPTCSVSVAQNPIQYGATTSLSWGSANATSLYINSVGYVTPNASSSAVVGPLATTNYDCQASNGLSTTTAPLTLTVNPPAGCTFNGQTVDHGSSTTAYQSPSVPTGQSCASIAETRTCANGVLSGSYAYASCAVEPACALSVTPTSILAGQSSTLSWVSQDATSCTGDNFSTAGATSGDVSVSPAQTTTYTASCTGPGGATQCFGTGPGGEGALLSVSCTLSWSCTGPDNQTIQRTNTDCSTTDITTCQLPEFCTPGSSSCIYEAIIGFISPSPRLVPSGDSTTISWETENAASCTVSGNGDTWVGASGSELSSPITQFTTYTLVCDDADLDTDEDDFADSAFIVRVPSWREI